MIDGASSATYSLFQATDEEFAAIFPDGRDMESVEDLINRLGDDEASRALTPLWERPILKHEAVGLHGTLFYTMRPADFPPPSATSIGMTGRPIAHSVNRSHAIVTDR